MGLGFWDKFGAWDEDRELPLFQDQTWQVAAIRHRCDACRGTIEIGQRYTRKVGMFRSAGNPWTYKEHDDCTSSDEEARHMEIQEQRDKLITAIRRSVNGWPPLDDPAAWEQADEDGDVIEGVKSVLGELREALAAIGVLPGLKDPMPGERAAT